MLQVFTLGTCYYLMTNMGTTIFIFTLLFGSQGQQSYKQTNSWVVDQFLVGNKDVLVRFEGLLDHGEFVNDINQ